MSQATIRSNTGNSKFIIGFGEPAQANPEVHFSFAAGALQGQYAFVTDQSCLAAFIHELRASAVIPVGREF